MAKRRVWSRQPDPKKILAGDWTGTRQGGILSGPPRREVRMRRFLTALPLLLASMIYQAEARFDDPVDLELALAVDVSRSVDAAEAPLQREGYIQAFRDPDLIRAIRSGMLGRIAVTYFEWAGVGHAEIIVGWTLIDGSDSAQALSDRLSQVAPRSARWTSISGGIDFALPLFEKNGFEGTRRVIDVSGDGPNNWGRLVTSARDTAVAAGVTINGLSIMDDGGGMYSRFNIPDLDVYYRDCVIGGPGAFLIIAEDFKDFARAVRRKMILEIAGRSPQNPQGFLQAQAMQEAHISPPCDIGEQLMRYFLEDF